MSNTYISVNPVISYLKISSPAGSLATYSASVIPARSGDSGTLHMKDFNVMLATETLDAPASTGVDDPQTIRVVSQVGVTSHTIHRNIAPAP